VRLSFRWFAALALVAVAVIVFLVLALPEDDEIVCDLGRDNDFSIIGHDVGVSTVLPDDRVLFLFGDTWIGPIEDGERQIESQTSNSGAILPAGAGICDGALQHITDSEGVVRQLIPLQAGEDEERIAYWPVDS
jgi:hypothetical protein